MFEQQSANNVAHLLAQAAYSVFDPTEWLIVALDFIICNLISNEV